MSCRKNQASLSPGERAAFVAAVLALKAAPSVAGNDSRYDDFVKEHIDSMAGASWAHRRPAFLPWHREYLRRYELALQEHDPDVTLPYWDWTVDNQTNSSIWDADFMGGDGQGGNDEVATGPFAHSTGDWDLQYDGPALRREFGFDVPSLPTADQVTDCLLQTPYDAANWNDSGTLATFRNRLEGWFGLGSIHNRVHRWVGGSMQPGSSPNDPVFFMHHCNVDRLWAQWQRDHPAEAYHPQGVMGDTGPAGHNLNDSMLPWGGGATPASTLDHHAMGYWYDTDPPHFTLTTPSLAFTNVPEGLGGAGRTTYRAIVFEVRSCQSVTFEIVAGPSGGFATTALGTSATADAAHGNQPGIARIWIAYTSTNPGDVANGSVTVARTGGSEQWVISLTANTIARPKSAVVLSLDRSGSMSEDAGDGTTKHQKLVEAVEVFVETMLDGDGLGIVGYDHIVDRHLDITDVGPQPAIPGSGRALAAAILAGSALDPRGTTGIGASVVEAQDVLDDGQAAAVTPYDELAIVVLTDGIENVLPYVATVLPSITAPTYAVGLGLPSGISTNALNDLAQATGKYLLVTGALTDDQRFRLSKFFLQILAGISGAQIVVDPAGNLVLGPTHRIPFDVSAADYGLDAILTSPLAQGIKFVLEAPDGTIIDPGLPAGGAFVGRRNVSYYRLELPLGAPGHVVHAGRWHALLSLDERKLAKLLRGDKNRDDKNREDLWRELRDGSVAYNFLAHAYSSLTFEANGPGAVKPGESALITATLTEYDVPVERRAEVWVEVSAPSGGVRHVALAEVDPGSFSGRVDTYGPGLHQLRVRARGHSFYGTPFTREAALSVAAVREPSRPPDRDGQSGGMSEDLLDFLACALKGAKEEICGMDRDHLLRCLEALRRAKQPAPGRARRAAETPLASPAAFAKARMRAEQVPLTAPVRLVEAPRPPEFPESAHHEGPMFGLSPEDQAIEDRRRKQAGDKAGPAGGRKGGGHAAAPKGKPRGGKK